MSLRPSLLLASAVALALLGPGCKPSGDADAGSHQVVGLECGDPTSPGNSVGIGKYCQTTQDCPVATSGTTIQCSTVLTNNSLPLLCSRLCGTGADGGQVDCGSDAVCYNIQQLGYDLVVCVPYACNPLFDGGLPRDGG